LNLTRRGLIGGAASVAALGTTGYAFAQRPSAVDERTAIAIDATPIDSLSASDRDRRRFGALTFRSGLELRSSAPSFGGFSGLWRSPDGRELVALSDNAQWLTARVDMRNGKLAGLSGAAVAPLLGPEGKLLRRTRYYDTEGLAIAGGTAYVSIERSHAVMRFDWARSGIAARGQFVPVPTDARTLPSNQGLEAIGVAPPRSPLAGSLVAIAERSDNGPDAPTRGFILTGPKRGLFEVARSEEYDVTDLAFLPGGEMLLLERRFSLLRGVAARLRRFAPDAIRPGARVDGLVIFESEASHEIDNMEGLSVHREGEALIVTMISDDNFSSLQRTLLLEFALAG
jgi:hypothetical protein